MVFNFGILLNAWNKFVDWFMYLIFWHPINHKMWFDIYRDMPTFDKRQWSIKFAFQNIGNNNLAKIDYLFGILRMLLIIAGMLVLLIMMIVSK